MEFGTKVLLLLAFAVNLAVCENVNCDGNIYRNDPRLIEVRSKRRHLKLEWANNYFPFNSVENEWIFIYDNFNIYIRK